MLKRFLSGKGLLPKSGELNNLPTYSIEEQGLCFPLSLADSTEFGHWQVTSISSKRKSSYPNSVIDGYCRGTSFIDY